MMQNISSLLSVIVIIDFINAISVETDIEEIGLRLWTRFVWLRADSRGGSL
jgi:hypothetical protein